MEETEVQWTNETNITCIILTCPPPATATVAEPIGDGGRRRTTAEEGRSAATVPSRNLSVMWVGGDVSVFKGWDERGTWRRGDGARCYVEI